MCCLSCLILKCCLFLNANLFCFNCLIFGSFAQRFWLLIIFIMVCFYLKITIDFIFKFYFFYLIISSFAELYFFGGWHFSLLLTQRLINFLSILEILFCIFVLTFYVLLMFVIFMHFYFSLDLCMGFYNFEYFHLLLNSYYYYPCFFHFLNFEFKTVSF